MQVDLHSGSAVLSMTASAKALMLLLTAETVTAGDSRNMHQMLYQCLEFYCDSSQQFYKTTVAEAEKCANGLLRG